MYIVCYFSFFFKCKEYVTALLYHIVVKALRIVLIINQGTAINQQQLIGKIEAGLLSACLMDWIRLKL